MIPLKVTRVRIIESSFSQKTKPMVLPGGERILTIPLALLTQNWITTDSLRHHSLHCA